MRHKIIKIALPLLLFALLLFPDISHAAPSFFEPVQGDKSIDAILKPMFGELFGGSSGSPFAAVIKIFNGACLTVATAMSAYVLIAGTMNTAHDGEVLGKRWSSVWVPIRTTLGLGLVAPLPSGFCVAQMLVAWAITQGVGLADNIWSTYTQSYVNQSSMTPMTTLPNVQTLASSILQSQVCMQAYNRVIKDLGESVQMTATGTSNGGRQYGGAGKSPDACGSVSFNTTAKLSAQIGDAARSILAQTLVKPQPQPFSKLTYRLQHRWRALLHRLLKPSLTIVILKAGTLLALPLSLRRSVSINSRFQQQQKLSCKRRRFEADYRVSHERRMAIRRGVVYESCTASRFR